MRSRLAHREPPEGDIVGKRVPVENTPDKMGEEQVAEEIATRPHVEAIV